MIKIRTARTLTAALVALAILLGAVYKAGYGTLCSFGSGSLGLTCPLGYLQLVCAGKSLLPQLWLSVGLVVLLTALLGRFFCAWICPTRLLKRPGEGNGDGPAGARPPLEGQPAPRAWASYSRYAVLAAALVSSFLFGFPVFCLICPVGLFFGALFAVVRFFSARQPSLELLFFPALLGLEVWALGSWCRSLCPLGALLGLAGRLGRVARPTVIPERCLAAQGAPCQACQKACPEGLDPAAKGAPMRDCTRCLECYERCPARALRLPRP